MSVPEARRRSAAAAHARRAGRPARSASPFARGRNSCVAILLAVLVAVFWQSFLTQTHEHFGDERFASIASADNGAASQEGDRKAPSGLPDNCWICRAVAHADHLLLPQVAEASVAPATDFWFVLPSRPGPALTPRSHAWQSRAPPSQLQA